MTAADATSQPVAIGPRVAGEHGLSRIQQQIWASQRLHRGAPLANMAKLHHITGPIDAGRLVEAFDAVVRDSDALRSVVVDRSGEPPVARILAEPPAATPVIDLPVEAVDAWAAERIATPIDPAVCCYDSVLLRHGEERWTWWLDVHHLVIDAWAASEIYRLTADRYHALSAQLPEVDAPEPSPSFYDWVDGMADRLARGRADRVAFWEAMPTETAPVAPYGPRGAATTRVARVPVVLDESTHAALAGPYRTLSRELSLIGVFATALSVVLHRLDGRSSFTFGVPLHHRSGPVAPRVIGPLMELYPMSITVEGDETFLKLFGRVQRSLLDTMRNAKPGESPDRPFDAVLNVLTAQFGDFAGFPTSTEWVRSGHVDPAHPIRVHAYDYGDGIRAEIDVNEGLSLDDLHRSLPRHIEAAVRAACVDPDSHLGTAALADTADLEALSALVPAPVRGGDQPVHDVIRAHLRSDPGRIVAECDGARLSAGELDAQSDLLAAWLIARGAETGSRIGVRMERSLEVLVALQGVLRSGAAFVMMDPQDPPSRHAAIEADAELLLVLDELPTDLDDAGAVERTVAPTDLAYVLYTSGSTGLPKGVPISHRGLSDYLHFAVTTYCSGAHAPVVALHSSLVFDLTITSLFLSFVTDGRLIVFGGDPVVALGRIADDDRVTFLKATPSQLEILSRMVDGPRHIRTVVVGGEAFRRPVAVATAGFCHPEVRIFNEYGPTEAVVGCMIHEWNPQIDLDADVPIGHAAPGCEITLLDRFGQPTVTGAWGELYVRREGMATGYLNRPELTAERFVRLADVPGQLGGDDRGPWYRTGDRARLVRPGVAVYGGRLDDQMKVNGVRLEPAEVEAALVEHPQVVSALVRLWTPAERISDRRCVRCGLGTDVPDVEIDGAGVCSVCRSFDEVAPQTETWFRTESDLDARLAEARALSTGDYDCLHLLSGGKDSSYALYQLVERGWRVHALTLDNGFISEGAKENIRRSVDALGITHEFATTDAMNEIFRDSLDRYSNVCQGCYKTIYTMGVARADELGIPVVVTGLSRGQFFETRLIPAQFESGRFDPDAIDATVLEARKVYHHQPDAVTDLLPEQRVFDDDTVFERIEFLDFYRYVDVDLTELYRYLEENAPWVRPADTGRSTNCLINVAGIQVHRTERGYHNYAEPYSWDVRLGHKTRDEALDELDDQVADGIDDPEVRQLLDAVGYRPKQIEILTAWYQTADDVDIDPDELRRHVRSRVASNAVPAAFVRLDEMPLAASAKADVSALPAPTRVHRQGLALVEPTTDVERSLCEIWAGVLHVEHVGVTDDFFDLGGDSLAALEVVATVTDTIGAALDDAAVFHARTVRDLARLIDGPVDPLDDAVRSDAGIPTVEGAPLSAGEEAMLFDYRRDPDDTRYNVNRWYRLPADVDLDRLDRSIREVAAVHGPLHTSFGSDRTVLGAAAVTFERIASSTVDDFAEFVDRQRRAPFDLDVGPLVRVHAAVTEDAESGDVVTSLLIGMHHICVDAGSFDVFWEQVSARYADGEVAEPSVTYAAHADWQRREVHPLHSGFWATERAVADEQAPPGRLALRSPVPPEPDGYRSRAVNVTTTELRRGPGRTAFVSALAAAAATLARFSGDSGVEVGITASVKDHRAAAPLVGYFLNTLPIRVNAPSNSSFASLASVIGGRVAEAIEHRVYPFASIVRDARAAGVRPPDVSVMLAYERLAPAHLDGVDVSHRILPSGTSVSDVTFFVQERGEQLAVGIEYSGRVVSGVDAQRLLDAFAGMIEGAVRTPDAPLAAIARGGDDAAADLVGPDLPRHGPTVLHDVVDWCEVSPDAIAVVEASGRTATYHELLARALATADGLTGDGDPYGVCVGRSIEVVVAMLAVQLAGSAYVPIDPDSPEERLSSILRSVSLAGVLADDANHGRFDRPIPIAAGSSIGPIDAVASARLRLRLIDPADGAYVIFTSGSTGRPRGVQVSHHNLAASTAARRVAYDVDPRRFLLTSSIGFDSSIVGLFWPLVSGGTIVLPSDDDVHDVDRLIERVASREVTHLLMVPSLYRALLARGGDRLESLEVAIVAGEACTPDVAELHRATLGDTPLYDEYGPTEATVWASVHQVTADDVGTIPIGGPIAGVTLRIADRAGAPVPIGVAGELLIAGDTVTDGYVDNPEATAQRFAELDGRRWYRTGDLVRLDDRRLIEYLGRLDDQLNVGGVRIEPGEIEAALTARSDVADAVVVASTAVRGRLVAHVEADHIVESVVRSELLELLPATHVPSRVVAHPRLPRTSHGKIDRAAAADLPVEASATSDGSVDTDLEASSIERHVAIWKQILGRDDIDASTDYFAAGGDSIAAVEIVMATEELVGRRLAIGVLLDGRTPAGVAALAEPGEGRGEPFRDGGARLITMQNGVAGAPLVVLTTAWDDVFGYRALVDALPDEMRVVALTAADVSADDLVTTIDGLSGQFMRLLFAEAADDLARPITVLGWSTGGVVAYELAAQLRRADVVVQRVAMVDTYFPGGEQRLWSNRWWKYKSLTPAAIVDEASTTVQRRAKKSAAKLGARLLSFAGTDVPEAPERSSSGGVPLEAFSYRPKPEEFPVVLYAATTTNPERTHVGWRAVADVDVVSIEGRHRGFQSIMAADRVHRIAADLATRSWPSV